MFLSEALVLVTSKQLLIINLGRFLYTLAFLGVQKSYLQSHIDCLSLVGPCLCLHYLSS
jgi:hypothetical protein